MIRVLAISLGVVAGGVSLSWASQPQMLDNLSDRIDRLEYQARDNGFPVPPMPVPDRPERIQVAQSAAGLAVRVDRLEAQMRQYTGQMEEMNFRLRQLQEQLRRFQEDSEFRFQDLERGKKPRKKTSQKRSPNSSTPSFQQLGTPPQSLGQLGSNQAPAHTMGAGSKVAGTGPIDLSSMLGGSGGAATASGSGSGGFQVASLTGDPATDYDMAYGFILQGDYKNAETAFSQFLQAYSKHGLAANAHYWIGESQFQKGNYRGAIETLLNAYTNFPDSQKAPDMLLKTGMSLRKIDQRESACATYEELLSKFPNASAGIKKRVLAEIKGAQC